MPDAPQQTPEWWLDRLYVQLAKRRDEIEFFDAYYRGEHPLPWLAPQAAEEFRRILQMTRSNYMGLVVDAMVERLQVEGFRVGDSPEADSETWRIWQANGLDTYSDQAWLEAGIGGRSFMHIAPNKDDASTPHQWIEHPSQAIVAFEPGTNRRVRAAGLKVWVDDWTGWTMATLQWQGALFKYQAEIKPGVPVRWVRREVPGEKWGVANPLKVVTLIELPNNPRLLTGGVSELYDVTDIQDRVNKTLADRLMTQDYGAFPQKWIKGWPEEDNKGDPLPPLEIGRNRIVTTDVTEAAFGQWDAAPLDPYSGAKREDVKDIASRTRTPAQYLLGEMSNVNGETLKASESGLVSKCRQRSRTFGEALEDGIRLTRLAAGLSTTRETVETIWRDPQYRTEGEATDAAIKRFQAGLTSKRQAREDLGYSAEQIARLEADDVTEGADPISAALVQSLNASAPASGG